MRIAKPYIMALIVTLLVTIAISWLPHSGNAPGKSKGEVAVFHPTLAKRLNNGNLVDMMVGLQLSGHLAKVNWDHAILSVDMQIDNEYDRPDRWFSDMEKLIRLSFVQMENVNRILIRYMSESEQMEDSKLLFAVDVRVSDRWLIDQLDELSKADPIHDAEWRKHLRLSLTKAWEERFGPANVYSAVPRKSQ